MERDSSGDVKQYAIAPIARTEVGLLHRICHERAAVLAIAKALQRGVVTEDPLKNSSIETAELADTLEKYCDANSAGLLIEVATSEGWPDILYALMDTDSNDMYTVPWPVSSTDDPRLQEHAPNTLILTATRSLALA